MENTFQINQQSNVVFDYLTDMQKFKSVHPAIETVNDLGNNNYLVHEILKFGPWRYLFTYPVIISANRDKLEITKRSVIQKFNHLEVSYRMIPTIDFTIVEETITFKSYFPIQSLVEKMIRKNQVVLFQKVNDLPED